MKDSLYEQLSALVDDELTGAEHELLFRRIADDDQLYQRLARYQLISDALQSHLPERVDPTFSRRVTGSLRAEPALSTSSSRLAGLARPAAGLAVAASVAVMAVMSIQSARQENSSPAEVVASVPPAGDYLRVQDDPDNPARSPADRKLDIYLVNHNEYAINRGMQGMLPYVRIVGHEMNRGVKE
jgi:sigma-E factor negative regulatory protein RseA